MKWPILPSCLLLFLSAASAWAVPSITPRLKNKEIRVGLLTSSYLTRTNNPSLADSGTGNMALNVGLRTMGNKGNFLFGLEGDFLYGLRRTNYRYLDIAEAHVGFGKGKFFSYVGRKRFNWSILDSQWSLGLYQPRFRWDYLNERESGLVGLFVGAEGETFQAMAYYSPIFVPEQGAPFDIDGGNCSTSSPWFSCPASSISLFNQTTAVRFSLDIPPVRKLVHHWGAGATARVGKAMGPFARASFTHKPINQLLLSYTGQLDLTTLQIPAVIRPRVLYHDLLGIDAGWNWPRHALTASSIWERPKRDVTPATWNTQEAANAFLHGLTVKTMPLGKPFSRTRFEFAFFHREGGNAPDRGPFAQSGNGIFEPRYAFQNAYSVGAYSPILDAWASSLLFSVKFILDTANQGNILQTDAYYRPFARAYVNVGLDMLGSESRSPVDFISRYQRNDRIRGGIAYAF